MPRGWFRLLADPDFGRFMGGNLLFSVGMWVHAVAATMLAFELTGSALVVGLVSAAQFVPPLVLAPLGGLAADHGDRRAQLVAGRLVTMVGSGGLALWLVIVGAHGLQRTGAGPLVGAALVVGLGAVLGGPAMQALVPSLVRPGELPAAVSLSMLPIPLARAIGPVLGSFVVTAAGPALAFAIAFACNLVFVVLLVTMRVDARAPAPAPRAGREPGVWAYLRGDRTTIVLLFGVAAIGVGADPSLTLAPAISDDLGLGTTLVGPIATAFGTGAAAGLALVPVLRRILGATRYGHVGLAVMAVGSACVVPGRSAVAVCLAFALSGVGMTIALTGLSTAVQLRAPDRLRGRVMALWSVAFLGARPFAAAVDGAVADALSPTVALLVVCLVLLGATWLGTTGARSLRAAGDHQSQLDSSD